MHNKGVFLKKNQLHQRAQKPALDRKSEVQFCGIFPILRGFFPHKNEGVTTLCWSLLAFTTEFRGKMQGQYVTQVKNN